MKTGSYLHLGILMTVSVVIGMFATMDPSNAAQTRRARTPDVDLQRITEEDAMLQSRIMRGLEISPVRLNMKGRKAALVGLGSYIVNAQGACNDCHTNPPYAEGGNPFEGEPEQVNTEGFLAGGTDFGIAVSSNITPDENGLPAGLTWEEFKNLMRTGVEDDGALLQVMPWPIYNKMTDLDLMAVYEYLSAIPAVQNDTGERTSGSSRAVPPRR